MDHCAARVTWLITCAGLGYGHTGHVRFLSVCEVPTPLSHGGRRSSGGGGATGQRERANAAAQAVMSKRASGVATTLTMATKMLVISGGDGYENFHSTVASENLGRDDSTNHLLLWQV